MDFQHLKLIGIGHLLPDPRWRMNAHSHAFYEMIIVMAGRLHVEIAGKQVAADSGAVLFYPAGVAHREWSDAKNPFETYYISFKWSAPTPLEFCMKQDTRHHIRQLAGWLFADRIAGNSWKRQQIKLLLQLLLGEFFAPEHSTSCDLVVTTRDIILSHIAEPLLLEQLAKHARLSKYHFVRKFKTMAGRTPMAEARALRINHAKDLLLTTDLPLKEIATRAGLGDEYALSRAFRRYFDMPPGAFRRRRSRSGQKPATDRKSAPKHYAFIDSTASSC